MIEELSMASKRGCGYRKKGAAYGECRLAKNGRPLEDFIFDPPVTIDADAIGLVPVSCKLIQHDGLWHVMDWVGEGYYPNVADFLEEARRMGVSRRLSRNMEFSKLTAGSKLLLVHRRAWIETCYEYYPVLHHGLMGVWEGVCPTRNELHQDSEFNGMCAGLWWQDIDPRCVELLENDRYQQEHDGGLVTVKMPSFEYWAIARQTVEVPIYFEALFAGFPMNRIVVVYDPDEGKHEDMMKDARKSGLPVDLVEA